MPCCLLWKVFRKLTAMKSEVFFCCCFDHIFVIWNVRLQSSQLVTACINIDLVPENQWAVCNPAVDTTALLLKYKSNILKLPQLLCLWSRLRVSLPNNRAGVFYFHISNRTTSPQDLLVPVFTAAECVCLHSAVVEVMIHHLAKHCPLNVWLQHPGCWRGLFVCSNRDAPRALAVYFLPSPPVSFLFWAAFEFNIPWNEAAHQPIVITSG